MNKLNAAVDLARQQLSRKSPPELLESVMEPAGRFPKQIASSLSPKPDAQTLVSILGRASIGHILGVDPLSNTIKLLLLPLLLYRLSSYDKFYDVLFIAPISAIDVGWHFLLMKYGKKRYTPVWLSFATDLMLRKRF